MTRISFLSLTIVDSLLETISPFEHTKAPLLAPGTILESFDFQGNPLRCDCRMGWIREWIEHVAQQGALASAALSTLNRTTCVDSSGEQRNLLEAFDHRSVQTVFLGSFGRRKPLRCDTPSAAISHMPLTASTVFWTSLA
ncbi:leucine Rich Repeat family protein, partial [Aphelenchoides avenae]